MDVFLLTSFAEGLPNVVVEAQSVGLPILVTSGGGSAEALIDGVTGFVIDNRNPARLADKLIAMLDDIAWRENASRRGEEYVRNTFGIDRMGRETVDAYGVSQ